ncbi:hypothetical protein [Streptomyces sp. H34-S4]|uniref:hypothetical protein n=1 Tax=Streptomyces sp. H34-S4 TaxID=2996463 RepID=UPI00226FB470|nr:hypothetical protein [Streptomyces sp. H34-S4]MCY0936925.1 hypothetical protein [Streptomyces sp. H34-S4]
MQALRVKRLFAVSAIGVLMAGGAALGAAGTASAATPTTAVAYVSHGGGWGHDNGGYHGWDNDNGYHHGWYDNDNDDDWGGWNGGYDHGC